MRKQIFNTLVVLAGIYLIISLSRDLQQLISARDRITKEQESVRELEQEQQELAGRLEEVMSDDFVEKEAREKLLMSKPGEAVVLLPEDSSADEDVSGRNKEAEEKADWEKWLRLFL